MAKERTLREFIVQIAGDAIFQQQPSGAMPAGVNGPYNHPETPIRNTVHWLFTWLHCFKWTAEQDFIISSRRGLEYILSPEIRATDSNWAHRFVKGRDRVNGVIGAAWIIEALVQASNILNAREAFDAAENLLQSHAIDESNGLWCRLDTDGKLLSVDRTFNHQLWFASAAARLGREGSTFAETVARSFLDRLGVILTIQNNGLIVHRTRLKPWDRLLEPGQVLHEIYSRLDKLYRRSHVALSPTDRDVGYQAFNLQALSVLCEIYPEHKFWKSEKMQKILDFARSRQHVNALGSDNRYAFPYNPVGFEMARAIEVFCASEHREPIEWIERQIQRVGGARIREYGAAAEDSVTARARIYEAVELSDRILDTPLGVT